MQRPYRSGRYRRLVVPMLLMFSAVAGAQGYHNHESLRDALDAQMRAHPELLRLDTVASSRQGREIWVAELGAGSAEERATRPAILIVAGLEGTQLFGTEAALAFIELALEGYGEDEVVTEALDSTTYYVFPRMNPDGATFYFDAVRRAQDGNLSPADDDHDGLIDEDGPDDLNGDGVITQMRIEDAEGRYRPAAADGRLMRQAKSEEGEPGGWRILTEGRDDDGDKKWNEDWPGGANLNQNFPFEYASYAPGAGIHQVSEAETRALADFVVGHQNIGIVFTFSENENLLKTPETGERESGGGELKKLHMDDAPLYKALGEAYREALGLEKELKDHRVPGAFPDWMYYHRGRLSLATTGWSPALQLALSELDKEEDAEGEEEEEKEEGQPAKDKEKKPDEGDEIKEDAEFLAWLDETESEGFVPWSAIDHPDFPGQRVEVGGFRPFVKRIPPAAQIERLSVQHASYLVSLSQKLPRIALRVSKLTHLGSGVFDLEVEVENTGYLPTVLAHGDTTGEVLPTRVTLDLPDSHVLAGTRISRIGALAGSGTIERLRYTIRKPADAETLEIAVVTALAGSAQASVALEMD